MKEDDDEVDEDEDDEGEGLLGGRGMREWWRGEGEGGGRWRRRLVRRLSLALAVYGVVVMVVCLVTNTMFVAVH